MLRFFRRLPSRAQKTPREQALQALHARDFERAEAGFDELLAAEEIPDAERAFLLNKRGVARVGCKRRQAARADFEAALRLDPRFAPAIVNLANLALDDGDCARAIEGYQAAIAADPQYALAYQNSAVAFKRAGRIDESVKALRTAQRLERANVARARRRL